jgi:signal peptidase I
MMNIGVISIRGDSMTPTMGNNDIAYVKEVEFVRGEIVVAKCPASEKYSITEGTALLKRIVGLPGEIVKITEDGVLINGKLLDESSYTDDQAKTLNDDVEFDEIYLSDREYYLLGDNRTESFDSRHVGEVTESEFLYALTTSPNDYTKNILANVISVGVCNMIMFVFTNVMVLKLQKKKIEKRDD